MALSVNSNAINSIGNSEDKNCICVHSTFSSIAICRIFHMKSIMPTIIETITPAPRTRNTPPTLSMPSSGASPPPPVSLPQSPAPSFFSTHHRSLSSRNFPSSCNLKMDWLMNVRQGESEIVFRQHQTFMAFAFLEAYWILTHWQCNPIAFAI